MRNGDSRYLAQERLAVEEIKSAGTREMISIVEFERRKVDDIVEKKKDVKLIVDVVISSNAEQNKNSFV